MGKQEQECTVPYPYMLLRISQHCDHAVRLRLPAVFNHVDMVFCYVGCDNSLGQGASSRSGA